MNPLLSYYPGGVKDTTSQQTITLKSLHEGEVSGKWRTQIDAYHREIKRVDKDAAKPVKLHLPVVTLAGKFSPSRKNEHLVTYSGIVFLDIDNLGKERAKTIRDAVAESKDPFVVRASLSSSHDGVRLLFRVTTGPAHHAAAWEAAANYFRKRYGVFLTPEKLTDGKTIDPAVKDLSRSCFVSHDPDAYFNPNALTLEVPNAKPAPAANGANAVGGENVDGSALDHLPAADITIANAADILNAIGDPDRVYNEWRDVASALRHQFPNEPDASRAFELFDEWSAKGDKYNGGGLTTRQLWNSIKPVPSGKKSPITVKTLIKMATDAGWSQARSGVEKARVWLAAETRTKDELLKDGPSEIAAAKASPADARELTELLRQRLAKLDHKVSIPVLWGKVKEAITASCREKPLPVPPYAQDLVFIKAENKFYSTKTAVAMTPDAVDNALKKHLPDIDILPHEHLLNRCNLPVVDTRSYDPAEKAIFTERTGRVCVNTYRRTYVEPDYLHAEEAGQVLQRHVAYQVEEPEHQRTLIAFMAYHVQKPGQKVNWAPVIYGPQGCGKSTLGRIMEAVLGDDNVRRLEASQTLSSSFNGYASGSQLVVFDETCIQGANPRELLEKVKPLITDNRVEVNRKYVDQETVRNIPNYMFFTNHAGALPVDENERRFFVVRSPLRSKEDVRMPEVMAHFDALHRVLEENPGAFRAYLETWQISPTFRPKGHAPETEYKRAMMLAAESPIKAAVRRCIEESERPSLQRDLFAFDDLYHIVECELRHMKFAPQVVSNVLQELGYRRTSARPNIDGQKRTLWASHDSPYAEDPDGAAAEFRARLDVDAAALQLLS